MLSGTKKPLFRFMSLYHTHSCAILIVKGEPFMDQKKIGAFLKALRKKKELVLRKIRFESIVGVCALAVYAALDITGLALKNDLLSSLSHLSLTLVAITTLMIPLYATGVLSKLQKKRKPSPLPLPLKPVLAAVVGYAAASLIKFFLSFIPLA